MSEIWEFETKRDMLQILIGDNFGPSPEEKIPAIVLEKQNIGQMIVEKMGLLPTENVLEIGSGCGYMSAFVAKKVNHLTCTDISQSFLAVAQAECATASNVAFHKIEGHGFPLIEDRSIDAAYAYNVFIHLNLFDIYLYLKELKRVLKIGGRVWFDFRSDELFLSGIPQDFTQMAEEYRAHPKMLGGLIQFHSESTLIAMAKSVGFTLDPQPTYKGSLYLRVAAI